MTERRFHRSDLDFMSGLTYVAAALLVACGVGWRGLSVLGLVVLLQGLYRFWHETGPR